MANTFGQFNVSWPWSLLSFALIWEAGQSHSPAVGRLVGNNGRE